MIRIMETDIGRLRGIARHWGVFRAERMQSEARLKAAIVAAYLRVRTLQERGERAARDARRDVA